MCCRGNIKGSYLEAEHAVGIVFRDAVRSGICVCDCVSSPVLVVKWCVYMFYI